MNYENGKIYCIRNSVNDEIYVGSTTQRLSKRFSKHKSDMKVLTGKLYQEMTNVGTEHFYIELIENYPCNSKEERNKKEGEYIREMGTLNYQVSGRTRQEYREENREKQRARAKNYYYNNREQELERGRKYKENNAEKIKEKQKNYTEDHKEQTKQRRSEMIECECGALISRGCLTRHKGRTVHQHNLENNILIINGSRYSR